MESSEFKTWAIVEVMGHIEYAGFVSQEVICGMNMLRVDVPECPPIAAFTKYLSPQSLYGITPVSEQTAKMRAASRKAEPFNSWEIERMVKDELKKSGLLLEPPKDDEDEFGF